MNDFAPLDIGTNSLPGVYNRPHHEKGGTSTTSRNRLPPQVERGTDRIELSHTARLIDRLRNGQVERQDLIAEVRAEIEGGRYETSDKIDEAIDELIIDL